MIRNPTVDIHANIGGSIRVTVLSGISLNGIDQITGKDTGTFSHYREIATTGSKQSDRNIDVLNAVSEACAAQVEEIKMYQIHGVPKEK